MDKPCNYIEALEIDRPEKWTTEALKEAGDFMDKKGELFQEMSTTFLEELHPELVLFLRVHPLANPGVVDLMRLIWRIGYLKGLSVGESKATTDELDKMWEG